MKSAVNSKLNLLDLRIFKNSEDRNTIRNYFMGNLPGIRFFELIVEVETFYLW